MQVSSSLADFVGQRIVDATRRLRKPRDKHYDEINNDDPMPRSDLFSVALGALELRLSKDAGIGISHHAGAQSIDVWPLDQAPETWSVEYSIDCDDSVYSNETWKSLKGAEIKDILVHRADYSSGRPNQRALSFKLDNGLWFAAAYNIGNTPYSLCICKYEDIEKASPGLIIESMSVLDPAAKDADWGEWDHL